MRGPFGSRRLLINHRRNNSGGVEMEQLIEAALAHAKHLRECAKGDADYGARVTEADAERGERLAMDARLEVNSIQRDGPRR
jgi:hypothetical protein